jgi:hypothetical protein
MFNRAARAGLVPGLIVSLVLASALLVPTNQGNGINLSCSGYGYPPPPCAAPDVFSVHPGAATIHGGTVVTITGTNFNNIAPPAVKPIVKFGGVAATVVSFTDSKITAIAPAHAAGVVDVTVTTAAGPSVVDPGDQYRYVSAPYCALFDFSRAPTSWTKGHAQKFYVYIFNCGTASWPTTGPHRIDINVHFTTRAGSGWNTQRYWLTQTYHNLTIASVRPNQTIAVAITLNPTFRGSVLLEAEMIKLHQFWFGRFLTRPSQFSWKSVVVH